MSEEDNRTKLQKKFEEQTPTIKNVRGKEYLQTYCAWLESKLQQSDQQNKMPEVDSSTLLPDEWKVYKCTDCQKINVKKDNRKITVGYCDNCIHPLWNDDDVD